MTITQPTTASPEGTLVFPDLRATVYLASVPNGLAEEIDQLYSSLFTTMDWFATHDDAEPTGACILERPRHVLLFYVKGDTLEVLNKAFEIAPQDARRACTALFRAVPRARRIHLEVMFPPAELRLPLRTRYVTDHMMIDLPDTVDAYYASLGRSMRRNLRSARNHLRRDHPDAATAIVVAGDDGSALLEDFLTWKRARFGEKGRTTYWDDKPDLVGRFVELLRRRGEAHVTTIGGRRAAINFVFPVGDTLCAQESSFDPRYERAQLGLLSQYEVVTNAVERGAARMNLLWGSASHKRHFGAVAHRAAALSVFRDQTARLWSLNEAAGVGRRRLRRAAHAYYWKTRHAAGDAVRARRRRAARDARGGDTPPA